MISLGLALVLCCVAGFGATGCDGDSTDSTSTTVVPETTTTTTAAAATTTIAAPAKATTTTVAPSGPAPQEHLLKGTCTWDIDGDGTADLWNEVANDLLELGQLLQFLQCQDGARTTRITGKAFATVTLGDLQAATYSTDYLPVEPFGERPVIMEGEVIGVRTSDGNYAKLGVVAFESFTGSDGITWPRYNIMFQYEVYP